MINLQPQFSKIYHLSPAKVEAVRTEKHEREQAKMGLDMINNRRHLLGSKTDEQIAQLSRIYAEVLLKHIGISEKDDPDLSATVFRVGFLPDNQGAVVVSGEKDINFAAEFFTWSQGVQNFLNLTNTAYSILHNDDCKVTRIGFDA